MGGPIGHAVRQELMQMSPLPPHHDLEHPVERGETDVARDLYAAPDGGLAVPEGDFELVQSKVRRSFGSWHGCVPIRSQEACGPAAVVRRQDSPCVPLAP